MIRVQLASVDAYYPSYHIMFRQVSEKNTKALQVHNDIEEIGLRMDLGQIIDDDATIIMTAMDNNGIRLNKAELEEGTFPKNEKDIVVSKGVLEELGIQGKLGDEITIPYQIYEKDGMGYAKEDTFRICGFMESSDLNKEKKMYFCDEFHGICETDDTGSRQRISCDVPSGRCRAYGQQMKSKRGGKEIGEDFWCT